MRVTRSNRKNQLAAATSTATKGMLVAVAAFAAASAVPTKQAHAQTLYWDSDGTGAANGGAGLWLGGTTNAWASDLAGTTHQAWTQGADAKFPQGGNTITFNGNVQANSIEYLQNTGGYTFQGNLNTLTLGSGGITTSNGSNAGLIINATITGNSGLNITKNSSAGTINILRFGSANTFTGDVNINSNAGFTSNSIYYRISLDAANAFPASSTVNFNTTQAQISAGNGVTAGVVTTGIGTLNLNGGGNAYLGAFANTATGYDVLTVGSIHGSANLNFQTQTGGGGGVVQLNGTNTDYTGDTYFNTGATGFNKGWVVWGANNALPTTTNINIGGLGSSLGFGTGALDLAGFSQSVNSFGTTAGNTGASAGITNSGATQSVLTVTGDQNRIMNAPIGVASVSVPNNPTGPNVSNISLVLAASHTGTLTLNNNAAGNSGNTYTGATLVHGGTLLINGWNSSTASTATIDAGANFGGSGTYAGNVTSSGTIYVGGDANVADFHTGPLTLNPSGVASGSALKYDMTTTSSEKIVSSGAFTLPTSGTETVTVNYLTGSLPANGIFSLVTYSGTLSASQFATISSGLTVTNGGGATYQLLNDSGSLDLQVSGGINALIWKGVAGSGSGTWDIGTTSNWTASGVPSTYANGNIVGFDDTANGTAGSAITVTIDNGGTPVQPYQAAFNNGRAYTLDGKTATDVIGGTASLVKGGTGSLTIAKVQQYTGDTNINGGTVIIGAAGGVGATNVFINPTGTLSISGNSGLGSATLNLNGGKLAVTANAALTINPNVTASSTIDTGTNTAVSFSTGALSGTAGTQLTRTGSGTLTLHTPATSMLSGWNVTAGTVVIDQVDSNFISGIGVASGTTATSWFNLQSGATLQIANVQWGDYRNGTSSEQITMNSGSTLLATGPNAGYGRASAATNNSGLSVVRGADSNTITNVALKTSAASDVFVIQNAIRQVGTFGGVGNSLITMSGPGTIKLQDGGVSSATVYAGSWLVQSGTLQVGPVIFNPAGSGYGGPFGEPLNALGFAGTSANGDPDSPNPVTLTGGILALGDEQPNAVLGQNPNITSVPVNDTPNYLRNPITLNGGALAATAFQVSYDTGNGAGNQGQPTATKVTAHFGGDLTVQGTASRILTYNPSNTAEARTVQLVGGSRTITTTSPNHAAGSTITYVTTWGGTLTVDPGTTTGGSFDIIRDAGTFSVSPTASLAILANGTVNLGGAADSLTDGTNSLNITNSGALNVTQGTKNVGAISGTGTTTVSTGGVTVIAKSITQGNLVVSAGTAKIRASGGANSSTSNITTLTNISGTGKFDITDNKVVSKSVAGTWNGASYTGVSGLVASGKGTGNSWNGTTGIITSAAAAQNSNFTSIGVAKASDVRPSTATATASWGGQTITGTDTLVMYTYGGDATLDGKINVDDYIKIDSGIAAGLTGWSNGDFNYDGKVNIDDYTGFIDANIGTQGAQFPTGGGIAGGGLSGVSAVPEPATISLLGLAAVGMLKRRRRQAR